MTGHIVVDLSEILQEKKKRYLAFVIVLRYCCASAALLVCLLAAQTVTSIVHVRVCLLTETKKLLVPSLRPKKSSGNSFNHVSSP